MSVTSEADVTTQADAAIRKRRKLWLGAGFVGCIAGSIAFAGPFLSPVLRKHCLPYLPATENTVL